MLAETSFPVTDCACLRLCLGPTLCDYIPGTYRRNVQSLPTPTQALTADNDLRRCSAPSLRHRGAGAFAARFAIEHPHFRVEVLCTDRYLDLAEEDIDLAFQVGMLDDSGLRQRALARLPETLVAAPAYLSAHPNLRHPDDVMHHAFVGLSIPRGSAQALQLSSGAEEIMVRPENQLLFDTPLAVPRMSDRGGGIGRIHLYMVAADLRRDASATPCRAGPTRPGRCPCSRLHAHRLDSQRRS